MQNAMEDVTAATLQPAAPPVQTERRASGKKPRKGESKAQRQRVNGRAGAKGTAPATAHQNHELGKAGSDDASELSDASAACSSTTAGTDRLATADLAESAAEKRFRAGGTASGASDANTVGAAARKTKEKSEPENPFADVPPGRRPLPINGEAFVKAVHRQVDLVQLEVLLLRNDDIKIVQRELAYLRELRYGKRAPAGEDEPAAIIFDAPRPERNFQ